MRTFSWSFKLAPLLLGITATLMAPEGSAQIYKAGEAPTQMLRPQLGSAGSGCPAFMRANQRPPSARQIETRSVPLSRPAQGLTVTIVGLRALRTTSAEVVVHALSPKKRAILTSLGVEDADVARSFQLTAKEDGQFSSDLQIDNVSSIRWIELKSLTYSDGSVWRESETAKCSVKPDPFVLISSTH
jgi:hypothetical protein